MTAEERRRREEVVKKNNSGNYVSRSYSAYGNNSSSLATDDEKERRRAIVQNNNASKAKREAEKAAAKRNAASKTVTRKTSPSRTEIVTESNTGSVLETKENIASAQEATKNATGGLTSADVAKTLDARERNELKKSGATTADVTKAVIKAEEEKKAYEQQQAQAEKQQAEQARVAGRKVATSATPALIETANEINSQPKETLYDTTSDAPPSVLHKEAEKKVEELAETDKNLKPITEDTFSPTYNVMGRGQKFIHKTDLKTEIKQAEKVYGRTLSASAALGQEMTREKRAQESAYQRFDKEQIDLFANADIGNENNSEYNKLVSLGYSDDEIKAYKRLSKSRGYTHLYQNKYGTLSQTERMMLSRLNAANGATQERKREEAYNYLISQGYSKQEISVFCDLYQREQNAVMMNDAVSLAEKAAEEHPVLGTAARLGVGLVSPAISAAGTLDNVIDDVKGRGYRYKPSLDENNPFYIPEKAVSAYDAKMLERFDGNPYASIAYKVGTNMVDNMVPAVVGGPTFGAAYNAVRAFNSGVILSSEKGMSPEQALVDGLVTAGLEYTFEKISLGEASFMQKSTGTKSIKNFLTDIGKDFIGEGSEEAITEVANIVYDTAVHGDRSDYQETVKYYQRLGMNEDDARILASKNLADQIGEAGLLGGLSGAAMSGGASIASSARNAAAYNVVGGELKNAGLQQQIIASGKAAPETTQSYKTATKLDGKAQQGKKVSNIQLAKLHEANSELINRSPEGETAEKMKAAANAVTEAQKVEIKHPDIKTESGDATVNKITEIKDGKITVETTEKTDKRIEVITPENIVDETARSLMEYARNMTVEAAQSFLDGYQGGDVARYGEAWDFYFNMGKANVNAENARRLDSVYYNAIGKDGIEAAIKSGWRDREFKAGVTDLSTTRKTHGERMMFRVMEGIAAEFGTEFIVVDDIENTNGYYIGDTNRIVISRNAEEGMLLRTAGHESFHFIAENNTEGATALKEYVLDELKKNGMDIEAQVAKLRERYSGQGEVTDDYILEEIVADGMFDVFSSKEAINRFARKNNPKIVERVIQAIEKVAKAIRSSLEMMGQKLDGSGKYVHPEIKALVDDYEALEGIRTRFDEAMKVASASFEADKNKKTAEKAAEKQVLNIQYSNKVDKNSIIDLSNNTELNNRILGEKGSEKYKTIRDYILEVLAEQPITLSDGKKAIVDRSDALHIANKSGAEKTAQISNIKSIIENAHLCAEDLYAEHNKFNQFYYYEAKVKHGESIYPLYINVGKAKNDGKYHIYDITKKIRDTANRTNGLERPKPNEGYALENDVSKIIISNESEKVNNKITAEKAAEEIKYSFKNYSQQQIANWSNSKRIVVYDGTESHLKNFVDSSLLDRGFDKKLYFGAVSKDLGSEIYKETGIDVTGFNCSLSSSEIRKILKDHGNEQKENLRGQRAVSEKDIMLIPKVILSADKISLSKKLYNGKSAIEFMKNDSNEKITVVAVVSDKHMDLFVQTEYVNIKKGNLAKPTSEQALVNTPEANIGTVSKISISQDSEDVNNKFSLKAEADTPTAIDRYYAEAIRENRAFSQIFALMGDIYSSKMGEVYLDNADIRKTAKGILKEFGSKYDEKALADELQIVYDYMANNRGNIDVDGCMKIFMQSAQNILESSEIKDDELWRHHTDLREFLREQSVYISPELKAEIESAYGDYKSFRSRLTGKMMHISTKDSSASTLDEIWGELNERAPEYFPKDVNDKDQPLYLTKFFESIAPKTVNPIDHYSMSIESESVALATRLFEEFGNIGRLKTTEQKLADMYKNKYLKLHSETQAMRRKLKADAERHKVETVEDYRRQIGEYKFNREKTEQRRRLRSEIDRSFNYINRRLERETDKDHVPERIKPLARELVRMLPGSEGFFSKGALNTFIEEYRKLEPDFPADDFEYMVSRMTEFTESVTGKFGEQPPKRRELDDVQLATLRDITAHVKYIVQNENRMFNENIKETAEQLSKQTHNELISKPESGIQGVPEHAKKLSKERMKNSFDSFVRKFVKPDYLFSNLGSETLNRLYREIRKGENTEAEIIKKAKVELDAIKKRNNYDERWKEQTVTVKARDGELTITVEDAMALYATSKRKQGEGHILNGGFEIEFKTKKGWNKGRRVFTPDDIRLLKNSLSKDQLNYMNEAVEYITKVIGEKRNETSMRMLGIRKYNEEYYFPIKTHQNFNDTPIGTKKGIPKIENQSSAKRTVKNADNPVVISGFTDTINNHVFDSAVYCAYAATLKDFSRVYNYRERNDAEGTEIYTDSRYAIKEDIQKANGINAVKEIENFMQALDSGSMDKAALPFSNKLASRAKKVAVMANLSVVVQQPTAVFRAMLYVNPKYFATWASKNDIAEMKQYNPGCTFKKDIGYFDINVGKTVTDYLADYKTDKTLRKDWSIKEKAKNAADNVLPTIDEISGWGASKADERTWGAIWNACKKQIAAENKTLSSEEVKQKAAELFQEVISKTQVYDSVFTKNAAMRSKSGFDVMTMQFMSEPMTTLNMLADAVVNSRKSKGTAEHKQAKKRCAAAFACYLTSVVVNSAVKSLVYSLRDDDEEKSFVEKYIGNVVESVVMDPFGMIPYLKDIISAIQGYDLTRTDTQAFTEMIKAVQTVANEDKEPWDKIMAIMKAAGYVSGLPFHTVMRDGKAVVDAGKKIYSGIKNGFEPTTGEGIKQSLVEIFDWVPGVNPVSDYDQLYNALTEGDAKHYEKIYNNLIESGKEEDTVNNELAQRLFEQDERIGKAYDSIAKGELTTSAELITEIQKSGFNQETIDKALNKYENSLKDKIKEDPRAVEAAEARADLDYDGYEGLIAEMVNEGYSEVLVKSVVDSLKPTDDTYKEFSSAEDKDLYTASYDLENAIANGDSEDVDRVYNELVDTLGQEKADSEMKSRIKSAYKNGDITESQAKEYLKTYSADNVTDDDLFWEMEELKGGSEWKKYDKLYATIKSGASVDDVLNYYTDNGVELKTVKSQITKNFKTILIEKQGASDFDTLYDNVVDAFVAAGDTEAEAIKKVNKWFEN